MKLLTITRLVYLRYELRKISYLINYYSVKLSTVVIFCVHFYYQFNLNNAFFVALQFINYDRYHNSISYVCTFFFFSSFGVILRQFVSCCCCCELVCVSVDFVTQCGVKQNFKKSNLKQSNKKMTLKLMCYRKQKTGTLFQNHSQ